MNWLKNIDAIDTSKLVKKANYDHKISDIEGKIPNITGLATTTACATVKNKIPSVNDIYQTIKRNSLYINLTDYNKFTKDILDAKIKEKSWLMKLV